MSDLLFLDRAAPSPSGSPTSTPRARSTAETGPDRPSFRDAIARRERTEQPDVSVRIEDPPPEDAPPAPTNDAPQVGARENAPPVGPPPSDEPGEVDEPTAEVVPEVVPAVVTPTVPEVDVETIDAPVDEGILPIGPGGHEGGVEAFDEGTQPQAEDANGKHPAAVEGAPPATFQPFGRTDEPTTEPEAESSESTDDNTPPRPPRSFPGQEVRKQAVEHAASLDVPRSDTATETLESHATKFESPITPGPPAAGTGNGVPRNVTPGRVDAIPGGEATNAGQPATPAAELPEHVGFPTPNTDGGDSKPGDDRPAGTPSREIASISAAGADPVPSDATPPVRDVRPLPPAGERGEPVTMRGTEESHRPAPRVENAEAIVRGMQQSLSSGRALRIRLDPPELGSLSIEITRRDGGLVARLEVDNVGAQRAVLEHAGTLGDQLARHGHALQRLDVELGDSPREDQPRREHEQRPRDEDERPKDNEQRSDDAGDDVDISV